MSRIITAVIFATIAGQAVAEQRYVNVGTDRVRLLGCYEEVEVPAKYRVKKVLIEAAREAYVKRANGTIEHVEYPAVYREDKFLVEPAYKLMKHVACK